MSIRCYGAGTSGGRWKRATVASIKTLASCVIGAGQPCAAVHASRTGRRSLTLRSAARAARGSRSKPIKNIVTTVGKGTDHIPQTLPTNGDGTAADDAGGSRGAAGRRRRRLNQRARAAAPRTRGAPGNADDRGGAAAAGGARGGGGDGTARRAARRAAAGRAALPPPPPAPRRSRAPPPSPPPDDDASDACASPPAAHRWRRYYDAETRAHYWYDARTRSCPGPTRAAAARPGPCAPADGRVPRALIAWKPTAPALPLLRRRVGRLRTGGGAEAATAAPARAGLPQGAAHATPRRLRERPVLNVETVTTVCLLTTGRRRARAARGPSSQSRPCGRASPGRRRRCA